jgi:exonuclease V
MGFEVRRYFLRLIAFSQLNVISIAFERLLNQIVSLVTLRDAGKAREIPIFGFFEDVFVMGVMDEIEKRPLPVSEEAKKNGTSSSESPIPAAAKITHFFKSASPAVPAIKAPSYGLYLVDSKTRRMPNLPKKEYTVAVSLSRDQQKRCAHHR